MLFKVEETLKNMIKFRFLDNDKNRNATKKSILKFVEDCSLIYQKFI